jgi:hypothetical protein
MIGGGLQMKSKSISILFAVPLFFLSLSSFAVEDTPWDLNPIIAKNCKEHKDFPLVQKNIQDEASLNKLADMTLASLSQANKLGAPTGAASIGQRGAHCQAAKASFSGITSKMEDAGAGFGKSRSVLFTLNLSKESECTKVLAGESRNFKALFYGLKDSVAASCPGMGITGGGYSGKIPPPRR